MKKFIIILSLLIIGIGLLYAMNPENTAWFPKCYFYVLTGFECPACGTQRAIHQLLHLNFAAAWNYNPFLVISVPYVLILIILRWFDKNNRLTKLRRICYNSKTINIYLALVLIWWFARNL